MQQEEQIIRTEYSELMQKSYIDYAMSVIIARALPEVPEAVQAVENLIKALPEYADVGPDDLADIEAADQAY